VARVPALRRRWRENLDGLIEVAAEVGPELAPDRIEHLVERYLRGREGLFEARIASGCIVDGHGDLRAEDIFVMPDGPRILDCLDFSDELRWGDRLLDAAFLAMDLEDAGRSDLAGPFLGWQRELAADTWPDSLAHHYVAYRASVRAKVAAIRAVQVGASAIPDVRRYCELAVRHLEAGRVDVVLVGGLPGTGKTSVARGLAARTGAVVLSSDEVRRELDVPVAGPAPGVDEGRYSPEARRAVYDELLDRAELRLRQGESVVLDASWSGAGARRRARAIAHRTSSDLHEVLCTVPRAVAETRITERTLRGTDASEATVAVARSMADRFDTWSDAVVVDTGSPVADVVEAAATRLGLGWRLVPA
jgi:predicted kinase